MFEDVRAACANRAGMVVIGEDEKRGGRRRKGNGKLAIGLGGRMEGKPKFSPKASKTGKADDLRSRSTPA